jgi:hypothetical protein
MLDWLLNTALNVTVLSLTALVGGVSLVSGYWGVLQVLEGRINVGSADLAISIGLAIGAWGLVRNKNDLVDR